METDQLILNQALLLSPESKLVLIEHLVKSLRNPVQSKISRQYINEIAEYAKTETEWFTWDEVEAGLISEEKSDSNGFCGIA